MPTVTVTAPPEAAGSMATTLVEERLAACVNRFPCQSVYRWDGTVNHEAEENLLVKTTDDAYPSLVDRIHELHPYETPAIERSDEGHAPEAVTAWLDECVGPE